MFVSFRESVALGALHGFTDPLPLSFSGHVGLLRLLFHANELTPEMMLALHFGTLAATLLVVWRPVVATVTDTVSAIRPPSVLRTSPPPGDALFVLASVGPAAAAWLYFHDAARTLETVPVAIAIGFLTTGTIVLSSRWAPRGFREQLFVSQALFIGFAQGAAVFPGASRSAATVVLCLWFGLRPARAFDVSILLGLPSLFGAVLLDAWHFRHLSEWPLELFVAAFTAFLVGVLALSLLRASLARRTFPFFAAWVLPLGLSTLALAWAWPSRF